MNIKTLLCSGLIAVLGVSSVKADSGGNEDEIVTRLTIHLESGSEEHYVFSSIPEITFSGTQMLVSSNSSQTAYERSEVAYFDFTKGPASSIDSTVATDTDYNFLYDGTTVRITGAHITSATIRNSSGVTVLSDKSESGTVTFNISGLDAGIYIVTADSHNPVKIIKQ